MKKDKISVVLPCLNEEETVGDSVKKAKEGIEKLGLAGEVIVVDNDSTDKSAKIAKKAGARVIKEKKKGYGRALRAGFKKARSNILVMGDADDTYDFREVPILYLKLKAGNDLVSGNRLKGNIDPEAMPFIHRYLGVPALSFILNLFFLTEIGDGHCGMRMFTKKAYQKMKLRCSGMEFASEMLIRGKQIGLKMAEVPISYGKRHTKSYSKLNSIRDGFRHLFFILKCATRLHGY